MIEKDKSNGRRKRQIRLRDNPQMLVGALLCLTLPRDFQTDHVSAFASASTTSDRTTKRLEDPFMKALLSEPKPSLPRTIRPPPEPPRRYSRPRAAHSSPRGGEAAVQAKKRRPVENIYNDQQIYGSFTPPLQQSNSHAYPETSSHQSAASLPQPPPPAPLDAKVQSSRPIPLASLSRMESFSRRPASQQLRRISTSVGAEVRLEPLMKGVYQHVIQTPKPSSSTSIRPTTQPLMASKNNADEVSAPERKGKLSEMGMALALFATYFAVMGAKCALPSTFSYLVSDSPQSGLSLEGTSATSANIYLSQMLTKSTLAIAAGKFLLGPVIDMLGGTLSLQITLATLCALLYQVSATTSFATFSNCWMGVDFMFSATWAACLSAIHQSFAPTQWVRRVAMLATAARLGNAAAFAGFAAVLNWVLSTQCATNRSRPLCEFNFGGYLSSVRLPPEQAWRVVFLVSSVAQLVPLTLITIFGRKGKVTPVPLTMSNTNRQVAVANPPKKSSPWKVMAKVACTSPFWLHLLARSALMVFVSFLLFVPTYVKSAYQLSSASAARVASLFALGCLTSVTLLGSPRVLQNKSQQAVMMFAMCKGAMFTSLIQMGHVMGWYTLPSSLGASLSFALWGFFSALPFYIPPSLYALEHGGKEGSATLSDVFDVGGFALLAKFNGYVARIPHSNLRAWKGTFILTSACAAVAAITLSSAIYMDQDFPEEEDNYTRDKKKQDKKVKHTRGIKR